MGKNNWFYGRGPAFPFVRNRGGSWPIAEGADLVGMGLEQAVNTEIGSRPMKKNLGAKLTETIFSLEGVIRDTVVKQYIEDTAANMEPRVVIDDVTVVAEDNELFANTSYHLITENIPRNKVIKIKGTE